MYVTIATSLWEGDTLVLQKKKQTAVGVNKIARAKKRCKASLAVGFTRLLNMCNASRRINSAQITGMASLVLIQI